MAPRKKPAIEEEEEAPLPTKERGGGRIKAELPSHQIMLPIKVGKTSDGSFLIDARDGIDVTVALTGDRAIRIRIEPEAFHGMDRPAVDVAAMRALVAVKAAVKKPTRKR